MGGAVALEEKAVAHYHALLREHADEAEALLAAIYAEQERRKVIYATKAIPTMLRPQFLAPEQVELLSRTVAVLSRALERVVHLYGTEEYVRKAIPFRPDAVPFFLEPTGLRRNLVLARFDSFLQGTELQYIEFNTDSPASAIWNEVHQEVFDILPMMPRFRRRFKLGVEQPRRLLLQGLLEAFRDFGLGEEPRLVIVDWREVATWPEFELALEFFEANGLRTRLADPRELEFRNGALWAGDFRANLVYRRVIWRELLDRADDCRALFDAAAAQAVCIANPFRAKVAGNKAILAFLKDPEHRRLFDAEELAAIDRHLPWTAVLRHRPVEFEGREVDPFDLALGNKDRFVLKPLNSYGGRGVMMGDEASPSDWEQGLAEAEQGLWCLQARVAIPEADFPVVDGGLRFEPRKINLNPFSIAGQYGGCFTRVSESSIINVTAGGGMIPTFNIDQELPG
jgi:hypothetical protein